MNLQRLSAERCTRHTGALAWTSRLSTPHGLAWVERGGTPDTQAVGLALRLLFASPEIPESVEADLRVCRDDLGKPYLTWHGGLAHWAAERGLESTHCQITNTHDGGAHLVLAAYGERLAGIGIDLVSLSRLRAPTKGDAYLRRFARHFMGDPERVAFEAAAQAETGEPLMLRVAAHFSLMEAASKAMGTGLKIGAGMGRPTSLPKQALGVRRLFPEVELILDETAQERMRALEAQHVEAHWATDADFLVSVVLLWRER